MRGPQFKPPLESKREQELAIFRQNVVSVGAWEPQSQLKIEQVLVCKAGAESLPTLSVDKGLLAPSSKGLVHHIASRFSSRTNTHL